MCTLSTQVQFTFKHRSVQFKTKYYSQTETEHFFVCAPYAQAKWNCSIQSYYSDKILFKCKTKKNKQNENTNSDDSSFAYISQCTTEINKLNA